jgi:aryl-alcohol dehydrogenase-like predicted oxidoreductase
MHNFIQQGKILYWGTSEWSSQEITEAHAAAAKYNLIGPSMEQPQYNMLHRQRFEVEYDQLYKNFGMGTTIWSPLASGLLTGKYKSMDDQQSTRLSMEGLEWLRDRTMNQERLDQVNGLKSLADELDMSMARLAIAWCLKNPNVSTVILGASKLEQLKETLTAIDDVEKMSQEVMDEIDSRLGNKPEMPIW